MTLEPGFNERVARGRAVADNSTFILLMAEISNDWTFTAALHHQFFYRLLVTEQDAAHMRSFVIYALLAHFFKLAFLRY